mmetsp:Transcript_34683/g.73166  ORF Transcript_34683/g.73166 Transcript_34683/m.73166 type:complete len:266 (+) Transcript_34683:80-877(+)
MKLLLTLLGCNASLGLVAAFAGSSPVRRHTLARTDALSSSTKATSSDGVKDTIEKTMESGIEDLALLEDAAAPSSPVTDVSTSTKPFDEVDAVKLFGRLAEPYIMIDHTDGKCCYGGCNDCEHRNPDGTYPMTILETPAPMWIPHYVFRYGDGDLEHETKWASELYSDMRLLMTKEKFVESLAALEYVPPGVGPAVPVSEGEITNFAAAEALFDVLSKGKERMARPFMMGRMRKLNNKEDGMNWDTFREILGLLQFSPDEDEGEW